MPWTTSPACTRSTRSAEVGRKKGKRRPKPAYGSWIVGHRVLREDPLEVELIEAGGPASLGTALAYLRRSFPGKRWGSLGRGLDFTASEAQPRRELDVTDLGRRAWKVGAALSDALDRLNATLRKVEGELLDRWPDSTASVFIETWEGSTHWLTWDGRLHVDTSSPSSEGRDLLTSSSRRIRLLACDVLAELRDRLRDAEMQPDRAYRGPE